MSVKDLTLDQLKSEWYNLEEIVDNNCNVQNIIRFELLSKELENRGYEIKHSRYLRKKDDK
jgi:hypothetical protein